jgi:peptidyl-prolyl cis-trans isomerase D
VLEVLRRGRRWGTAAIILLIGGVFVAYIGLGGPMRCGQSASIIEVDGQPFFRDDFQRALSEQEEYIRNMAGDAYDPRAAADFVKRTTADALVSRAILVAEAERIGLGVSREELRAFVTSDPSFRDEAGRLDPEAYKRFVTWEYGSEARFQDHLRRRLLVQKMARLLATGAEVSEAEARIAARYQTEEISLAYVVLDPGDTLSVAQPSDEDVETFAEANGDRIEARYEEDLAKGEYRQDEAARVRHILVKVARDAQEAEVDAARAKAEATLARVREGADFAEVAAEVSQDEASREAGGELGFVPRGQLAPELDQAAFSLPSGSLADVLRSDQGFHVLRVDERREAGARPLADVRDEIARSLLTTRRAEERARDAAEQLRAAIAGGASLELAAREQALSLERTDFLPRHPEGYIAGLGASLPLQDAAFSLPAGASAPRVFEVGSRLALIQVLERREADPERLAAATAALRERLLQERRENRINAWIAARRSELEAEGRLLVNLDALDDRS